jgi:hypothetical protein
MRWFDLLATIVKSFLVILISPFKIIISLDFALRRFFYNKEK